LWYFLRAFEEQTNNEEILNALVKNLAENLLLGGMEYVKKGFVIGV